MNKLRFLLAMAALAAFTPPLAGQQKRISPHETISKMINGDRVIVVYGRPYTKDPDTGQERRIWGDLIPFGEICVLGPTKRRF